MNKNQKNASQKYWIILNISLILKYMFSKKQEIVCEKYKIIAFSFSLKENNKKRFKKFNKRGKKLERINSNKNVIIFYYNKIYFLFVILNIYLFEN